MSESSIRLSAVVDVPPTPATLADVAIAIGTKSELLDAGRAVLKRPDNVLGLLLRPLLREEIAVMEDRGCRAEDWTLVQVAQDFDAFRVRRSYFKGRCALGRFSGDVEVMPGLSLGTGIYDCTIVACQIGNECLLEKVRLAANMIIERGAVIVDVGAVTCSGKASFGCGQLLPIACEVGGREVPVWAEMTVDQAALVARERGNRGGQQAVRDAAARYVQGVTSSVGWVRRNARIRHTERVRDCYVGAGAVIDHALELTNVAVLSAPDEATLVTGGSAVSDSVLQWGVQITGNAIVRNSVVMEHGGVDNHASVADSVIGPNTSIAKGEVTASLVGPFVGFHHQSLLISAFWPEGKGNVAYGAMVGSNHTSRAPDQECWPGEGMFFGLGCAIRFPADFSEAPYTTVSLNTTTLPQKVRFPFSLITIPTETLGEGDDAVPRAFNEIIPAWGLDQNAYGLVRTELKFARRDAARRHRIDYKVLRPSIMRQVKDALDRLEGVKVIKPFYIDAEIDGLGKNVLREAVRLRAIATYRTALIRYCLRVLLNEAEKQLEIPGSAEVAHELAECLLPGTTFAQRMDRLIDVERANAAMVQASKAQDDQRGARIIPGYADAHVPAESDPVVRSAWERVERTIERIKALTH